VLCGRCLARPLRRSAPHTAEKGLLATTPKAACRSTSVHAGAGAHQHRCFHCGGERCDGPRVRSTPLTREEALRSAHASGPRRGPSVAGEAAEGCASLALAVRECCRRGSAPCHHALSQQASRRPRGATDRRGRQRAPVEVLHTAVRGVVQLLFLGTPADGAFVSLVAIAPRRARRLGPPSPRALVSPAATASCALRSASHSNRATSCGRNTIAQDAL
jgi:hypothetical protein